VSPKTITPALSLATSPPIVVASAPAIKPLTASPPTAVAVRVNSSPAPVPTAVLVVMDMGLITTINHKI